MGFVESPGFLFDVIKISAITFCPIWTDLHAFLLPLTKTGCLPEPYWSKKYYLIACHSPIFLRLNLKLAANRTKTLRIVDQKASRKWT